MGREQITGTTFGVRQHLRIVLVAAVMAWSVLSPTTAGACSIAIVELDHVLASLDGEPVAEMGDEQIVGVVEVLVIGAWAETDTYRAASFAAPNQVWADAPELPSVIHGGQPRVPDTTTSCPDSARRIGTRWWLAVYEADDGGPGATVLISPDPDQDAQARFTRAFGDPQPVETPTVPDRHPSEPAPREDTPTPRPAEPTITVLATTTGAPPSAASPTTGSGPSRGVLVALILIALVALGIAITRRSRTSKPKSRQREHDR